MRYKIFRQNVDILYEDMISLAEFVVKFEEDIQQNPISALKDIIKHIDYGDYVKLSNIRKMAECMNQRIKIICPFSVDGDIE
jgi:hypothetical protein